MNNVIKECVMIKNNKEFKHIASFYITEDFYYKKNINNFICHGCIVKIKLITFDITKHFAEKSLIFEIFGAKNDW